MKSLLQLKQLQNYIGSSLRNANSTILQFVAPKQCVCCSELLRASNTSITSTYICSTCWDNFEAAPDSFVLNDRLIRHAGWDNVFVTNAFARFAFRHNQGIAHAIHSLKYNSITKIGLELGTELGKFLQISLQCEYDKIIPVPIHSARKRERGFNQAEIIAKGISSVTNIPCEFNAIKRAKYTATQTALTAKERRVNILAAIQPFKKNINIKHSTILLVDDVFTTGSTLNTCALVLLEQGAKQVDCITIASAE